MTVFTIGYEGLDINNFMSLLSRHGVDTVVDVRELPLSRRYGFSKKSLANILNHYGLEYVHLAGLGCPKLVRDRYRRDGNWKRYADGFMKHLKMQDVAINELAELVQSSTCALLCFEADFRFCHRSMVADAACSCCGADVEHIQAANAKTPPASPRLGFA